MTWTRPGIIVSNYRNNENYFLNMVEYGCCMVTCIFSVYRKLFNRNSLAVKFGISPQITFILLMCILVLIIESHTQVCAEDTYYHFETIWEFPFEQIETLLLNSLEDQPQLWLLSNNQTVKVLSLQGKSIGSVSIPFNPSRLLVGYINTSTYPKQFSPILKSA